MVVLVTDAGFTPETWIDGFVPLAAVSDQADAPPRLAIDLGSPVLDAVAWRRLLAVMGRCALIRVRVRDVGDAQAYDLARALRRAGYGGRLRAHGAVASRFYTLLRRAGFDEVELDTAQARNQPCEHWRNESGWIPGLHRPVP